MTGVLPEVPLETSVPVGRIGEGRIDLREGEGIRQRAARGTIVNAAFNVGIQLLGLLRGFVVAGFLAASQYGVYGLLIITLGTLLWLGQVGIDDKYIQQDHPDQEAAFQIAFTLQCMLAGLFVLIIVVAVPLFALAYGQSDIIAPGYVLAAAMPAVALQTPFWIFQRRMNFARQRKLQVIDPIVAFVLTVALAVAGLGFWALVLGGVAGSYAAAIVAVRASPYRIRFRYEPGTLREYTRFSWPLFMGSVNAVLIAQIPILIAQRSLGIAAVGAITLAGTISLYANRVDEIVTGTIYPAVCAAKERTDLLVESFTKTNRLALLWGVPFGAAAVLFGPDLIHFLLGERWHLAIVLIQIMGLSAGLNQIGFNWTAFYRALGNTRPIAIASAVMLIAVMAIAVPLLLTDGLRGYATGIAAATGFAIVARVYYLARLFALRTVVVNSALAFGPTVLALPAVLAVRWLAVGQRSGLQALAEVCLFVAIAGIATLLSERELLREFVGYIRPRTRPVPS
ncbi:MAG TPA: oligosaccharide flippase family protein [Solirubrobacteraceae bacterium]|nr:oligosaccharide flippase family protein [Solirubrobacteraceae bacterium]